MWGCGGAGSSIVGTAFAGLTFLVVPSGSTAFELYTFGCCVTIPSMEGKTEGVVGGGPWRRKKPSWIVILVIIPTSRNYWSSGSWRWESHLAGNPLCNLDRSIHPNNSDLSGIYGIMGRAVRFRRVEFCLFMVIGVNMNWVGKMLLGASSGFLKVIRIGPSFWVVNVASEDWTATWG
ncbi:hypothetical protein TIFTF001_040383 [Ficus carica]|uniref:Uncharacterized protein n=1 Tax=Ficus carica TaxID=3494 RepID=A0AA88D015_FICCA|nr:hypothetical protein TIFTF001_040383 [Ficus carica]